MPYVRINKVTGYMESDFTIRDNLEEIFIEVDKEHKRFRISAHDYQNYIELTEEEAQRIKDFLIYILGI